MLRTGITRYFLLLSFLAGIGILPAPAIAKSANCYIDPSATGNVVQMGISLCLSELARQKPLAGHNGAIYETVESYQSNGYVITAIRHPELLGKFPLRYRFSVLDENGNEAWFIALGSYESLTKISQELGAIDTNQRIYHLSEYRHGAMETYGFYENEPPFDQLKEMVTSIVAGQSKKLASASTGPDSDGPGQAEINQAIGTFRELMGAKKIR